MYELSRFKLGNALFIDIETTRAHETLEIDSPEFEAWKYDQNKEGKYDNSQLVELYHNRAALYPEFGRITCISLGRIADDNLFPMKSYYGKDEKLILEDFMSDLDTITRKKPSSYFAGHAILDFDIPYLLKRSIINGVPFNKLVDNSGLKPWEVNVLDTKPLWRNTAYAPTSLITMAMCLGIKSPKDDISGAEAALLAWSGEEGAHERIARYCEKDVLTVAQIIHKLAGLPELTMVTSVPEAEEEMDVLTYIFEGGKFTSDVKEKVMDALISMNEDDRSKAFDILSAATSTAKGKVTHLKKTDVTAMKKEITAILKKKK